MKHYAAALKNEPLIIEFSGGKDSIAMTDLLMRHHSGEKVFVFYYFVPGLEIKERILTHYERKYGIKINRAPSHRYLSMKTGKKWRMADVEEKARRDYGIAYIAQGSKKIDSMARRGMMKNLVNGVDSRDYRFYPVCDMSDAEVMAYCKTNKLMLPVEYSSGMSRDFWVPDKAKLLWIRSAFPADYKKIIMEFPQLENVVKREQMYGSK